MMAVLPFLLVLVVGLVLGSWALYVLAIKYAEAERAKLAESTPPKRRAGERITAPADLIRVSKHEATDALFDTNPRHLAGLFGLRAISNIRRNRPLGEVYEAAKLAGSYAFRAAPELKPSIRPNVVIVPFARVVLPESQRVH